MIAEIMARLSGLPEFKLVAGAAGFAAAADRNPTATPAAFVLRLSESAGASLTYSRIQQRVAVTAGIVIVVRNVSDATGSAAGADLEALRQIVRTSLLGWSPPGHDPLEFDASALLAFKDGHLWWQEAYRSHYDITSR
jgi:hypothetical protein